MKQSRFFEVYEQGNGFKRQLLTKNLVPGKKVYDEFLIKDSGVEYRTWNPEKSKLAAAIMNKVGVTGIKPGGIILYLGAASGTTASHVSDIVGEKGFVFALDFAPRVIRDLYFVCKDRKNMAAMLEDAKHPETYKDRVCEVDVVFQDIAQKDQAEIFMKNCDAFLKKGGFGLLAVKARSVDVAKKPKEVFREVRAKLERKFEIIDYKSLEPFEKDHAMFVIKKK